MTQATLSGTQADLEFRQFHNDNPRVYLELVKLARQAKASGRQKVGIKMLFEVIRWNRFLKTSDPIYKMNNNYHSRYARLIMENEPDLASIFDTRELRS